MGSARVRVNSSGARALLTSAAVAGMLGSRADAIAAGCNTSVSSDPMRNPAFMAEVSAEGGRAHARVYASSPHGIRADNKRSTLLSNLY